MTYTVLKVEETTIRLIVIPGRISPEQAASLSVSNPDFREQFLKTPPCGPTKIVSTVVQEIQA